MVPPQGGVNSIGTARRHSASNSAMGQRLILPQTPFGGDTVIAERMTINNDNERRVSAVGDHSIEFKRQIGTRSQLPLLAACARSHDRLCPTPSGVTPAFSGGAKRRSPQRAIRPSAYPLLRTESLGPRTSTKASNVEPR